MRAPGAVLVVVALAVAGLPLGTADGGPGSPSHQLAGQGPYLADRVGLALTMGDGDLRTVTAAADEILDATHLRGTPATRELGDLVAQQRARLDDVAGLEPLVPGGPGVQWPGLIQKLAPDEVRTEGWTGPVAVERPSQAVEVLAGASQVEVPGGSGPALAQLDALDEPQRKDLTSTLLAMARLATMTWQGAPGERLLVQRGAVAQHLGTLGDHLALGELEGIGPIDLCPVLALEPTGVDSIYRTDCVLIVDRGGNDTYLNNAGGSGVTLPENEPCLIYDAGGGAALLDLAGDDVYGDPEAPRSCGANGGGAAGLGMLIDLAGDDVYHADSYGTNGGGSLHPGLLVDLVGNDTYRAGSHGTNGGGDQAGTGALVDLAGDDMYSARQKGTNGGAYQGGAGLLLDARGDDGYRADQDGVNGGAKEGGVGLLVDLAGNDTYEAGYSGTNGGGDIGALGTLLDVAGDDRYETGSLSVNGGSIAGIGILIDGRGSDRYLARSAAANGGSHTGGLGHLVDGMGDDRYEASYPIGHGVNGGAATSGLGFLLDRDGDDAYVVRGYGANGGGYLAGQGFLLDEAGNDTYEATEHGTNGGGSTGGSGFLWDRGGNDTYNATEHGVNGGGGGGQVPQTTERVDQGVGLLLDEGGTDTYRDTEHGTTTDATVIPKGTYGALVDQPVGRDRP